LNKPRLLIILNRLSIGGPATNTLSVAAELCTDFDILLLAGEHLPDEQSADFLLETYKGFRVQKIKTLTRSVYLWKDLLSYFQIKKIIKEFKPHIVHTHGAKPGVLGRIAAWRLNVPVILHTFHGHIFHSYFSVLTTKLIISIERALAKISTAIIAINQTLEKELKTNYHIAPAEKIKLVKLGIDTNQFEDADGIKRKHFRTEFKLNDETIALGIIGRLVPVKNHLLFLEMIQQLLKSHQQNTVKFFIIGDGPEKNNLIHHLQIQHISFTQNGSSYQSSASVIFTSWRKDMDVVYAGLDIVALTSLNEGTPVSIMEAMASGKPIVSTNAGGISEIIMQNETGFISNNLEELVKGTLQFIQSENNRKQVGEKARQFAKQNLSKVYEVQILKNLYHNLLTTFNH
jgi:glycosyltransferase involved in cell wall biosynthesis